MRVTFHCGKTGAGHIPRMNINEKKYKKYIIKLNMFLFM